MSHNSVSARVRQTTALSLALAVALAAWLGGSQARAGDTPPPASPCFPGTGDLVNGDLWIGTVHGEMTTPGINHATTKLIVRLREVRKKPLTVTDRTARCGARAAAYEIDLVNENTQVEVTFDNRQCSGKSSTSYSENPKQAVSHIFYRNGPEPYRTGFPGYPSLEIPEDGVYSLLFIPPGRWTPGGEFCRTPVGYGLQNGYVRIGGPDPDPDLRRLTQNRSRMSGSYSVLRNSVRWEARWDLCKAGTDGCSIVPPEGPKGAPEPGATPPCAEPTNQQAHLDLALDQQKALMQQLDERYARYRRIADEARQYQSDFELAARDCKLWQVARVLLGFLVSNYAPTGKIVYPEPGNVVKLEPGKEFYNFLSLIEKVENDDGSWVLPNSEFKDWVSLEDAWDGFQIAYSRLGPSSPEKLLRRLQECGAPTNERSYQDALKYLRLLQQIEPLMQQVNRTLNDLRNKDIELFNKWADYQKACREYESCHGGDPASCESLQPAQAPTP